MREQRKHALINPRTSRNSPMKRNAPSKSKLPSKSVRSPSHRVPTGRRASANFRSWVGSGNVAHFVHPTDDRSLCQKCLERKDDDDEPCPMHPECHVGMCESHVPNWVRFCSRFPMTTEQRRITKRWVRYIMPELAPRQIGALTDEQLCQLIRNIDLEWRRPFREPEQFVGCGDDDLDLITHEPLSRIPHEVNGTFSLPPNPKERCADIRGVVDWWGARDRIGREQGLNLPHDVPQFNHVDSQELQARIRNWEGRNKFFREHFATEDELIAALNEQDELGAPVHVDWAELYADWNVQEANREAERDAQAAQAVRNEPVWRAQWAHEQAEWLRQQELMDADDLETLHRAIERRFMDSGDDDARLCQICGDKGRSIVHTGCRHCFMCDVCYVLLAEFHRWPAHVPCIKCGLRSRAVTIGEYTALVGNINDVLIQ